MEDGGTGCAAMQVNVAVRAFEEVERLVRCPQRYQLEVCEAESWPVIGVHLAMFRPASGVAPRPSHHSRPQGERIY